MSQSLDFKITEDDRLRQIARHIPGVIYQFQMRSDGSFCFLYASEGLQEIYGISPAELYKDASKIFQVVHPEDINLLTKSILESAEHLTPWYCEYRICLPDGRTLWLLGHSTPQREPDGSTVWHGYIRNITATKNTEIALRTSEDKFRSIIENLNDMVYIINADATFSYLSPHFKEVLGYELEELLNASFAGLIYSEDLSICVDALHRSFAGEKIRGVEYRVLHKDGNYYWHSSNISALQDDQGRVTACLGIAQYIHDHKQAELENQQVQSFLNSVIENIPNMVFVKDAKNLQFLRFNKAGEDLLGYPREALLGKSDYDFFPTEEAEFFIAKDQEVLANGKVVDIPEEQIQTNHQGTRILHTKKIPIFDEMGNPKYLLGISEDITDRKAAEAALRQNEQKYHQILDAITDMVLVKGSQSRIVWANKAFRDYYAMTNEQLQDMIDSPFNEPDYTLQYIRDDAYVFETGESLEIEEPVTRYDGTVKVFNTIKSVIRNEANETILTVGVSRDISDRKAAEAALAASEAQNRAILQSIPDIMFWVNESGIYLGYSTSTSLFDLGDQQPLGKFMGDSLSPEHYQRHKHHMDIALETRQTQIYEQEFEIAGNIQYEEVRIVPIEGKQELLFMIRDIGDRKQAEAELEEVSVRLSLALKSGRIGCWEWDIVQNTLLWDDRMYELYGVSAAPNHDLAFEVWTKGLHPDDRDTSEKLIQQAVLGQAEFNPEFRVVYPDGSIHFIKAFGSVLHDDEGNPQKMIGVNFDISDQKQAEFILQQSELQLRQQSEELAATLKELQRTQMQLIQSEKMSSLGQLVAGVAHEINNPISFIYGNIQPATNYVEELIDLVHLYQSSYPEPPQVISERLEEINLEYLAQDFSNLLTSMKKGATRIRDIIKSLRTFSRLDEEGCKVIDLHEGIESTLVVLESRFNGRDGKPEIQVIKDYGDLPLVECYGGLLNQVFVNLLMNAIDAIEQQRTILEPPYNSKYFGAITITTSLTNTNQAVISIQDNGCGMNAQVQEKIFNPFFTTKPIGQGTGMGLAISYQIMTENHQGNISVNSTPGKGTEFIITLPVKQANSCLI